MDWYLRNFDELTNKQLWEILYHRIQIFVVEQNRLHQEVDTIDLKSRHLFAIQDGKLMAYARMYLDDDFVSFGRVMTVKEARGTGIGKVLMEHVVKVLDKYYPNEPTKIYAQEDKENFYKKFGFVPKSEVFTHHGSPHLLMERK